MLRRFTKMNELTEFVIDRKMDLAINFMLPIALVSVVGAVFWDFAITIAFGIPVALVMFTRPFPPRHHLPTARQARLDELC